MLTAREYGEPHQQRAPASQEQKAAALAAEAASMARPTLNELDLTGAFIPLINTEVLSAVAASRLSGSVSGAATPAQAAALQQTAEQNAAGAGSSSGNSRESMPTEAQMLKKPSHRAELPPSKYTPLSTLLTQPLRRSKEAQTLLRASQAKAQELATLKPMLQRKSQQYKMQLELKRAALKQTGHLGKLLSKSSRDLESVRGRLQTFDDAKDILAEAGMLSDRKGRLSVP